MTPHRLLAAAGLFAALTAPAQQSANGTGSVTGHVTAGDTQRPARFAAVTLMQVPAKPTSVPDLKDADDAAQMKAMKSVFSAMGAMNMVNAQTTTDGSFTATDVAPGDYYVFASQAGYVSAFNQVQTLFDHGADPAKPLAGVPVVHVTADHGSTIDVAMQRGAAISGQLQWDDGSPVTGAIMSAEPAKKSDAKPPMQFAMLATADIINNVFRTDDQGRFRIAGLAPGDYVLKATLQTGGTPGIGNMNFAKLAAASPIIVYYPSAFHHDDAKTLTLHAADDVRDQLIVFKLDTTHTVSGHIGSLQDHHGLNQATVKLTDQKDKQFTRAASVDAQGNYTVTFLPPGTYDLTVDNAEDTEAPTAEARKKGGLFGAQPKTLRAYKDGKSTVIVTDANITGKDIELAIDTNPTKKPDIGGVLGAMFGGGDDDDDTPKPPPSKPKP